MTSRDSYRVDLNEVEVFTDALGDFVKFVEDRVGALDARIDDLHVSWTGEAASAHRDAHDRWRSGAVEIRQAMADIRQAAQRSHTAFVGVQELHRKMWP
ncbi:WXG100 family type VII secretion target [Gordonia sp. CPCC 206044]|uniref:WXG100 family type VII secretion target n=1 Tax=Gordonia sp. CPCC 206044 TaxID=3140793 RepID=UPI003AF3F330